MGGAAVIGMVGAGVIGVVGAGAWGQALAIHLARSGRGVALWARRPETVFSSGRSSRRLGVTLPASVTLTDVAVGSPLLVAVPMQHLRAVLGMAGMGGEAPLLLCCKGLEAGTGLLPHEVADATWPGREVALLTGPNFAHEVAAGLPAASVVASASVASARALAALIGTAMLRLYASGDPVGAGLAGAAKNVVAIAAGAALGAGLGENARAAVITRGLSEISRLTVALGGEARTVFGLSGAGDLVLTCTGRASRNVTLGEALGRGERLADVLAGRDGVTEGVWTAPALVGRAASVGVEVPIAATVAALLAGEIDVAAATSSLLARSLRDEWEPDMLSPAGRQTLPAGRV